MMKSPRSPRDPSLRVCSIYKHPMTGHWVVDTAGTKAHPGSPVFKEGFHTFDSARRVAAELVDAYRKRYHPSRWRRASSRGES